MIKMSVIRVPSGNGILVPKNHIMLNDVRIIIDGRQRFTFGWLIQVVNFVSVEIRNRFHGRNSVIDLRGVRVYLEHE